jgi:hypothetical protein
MLDVDEDDDLPRVFKDDASDRETRSAHGLPLWPWLAVLGLLTIGVGVVGAWMAG